MKKSSKVPASLIITFAATFVSTGCSGSGRECQDANGNRVSDANCKSGAAGSRWVTKPSNGFGSSGSGSGYGG